MDPLASSHRFRRASHRAVIAALFLALVGTIFVASPAGATADGSMTVHARLCPTDYAGSDFNGDCHDQPLAGAMFHIFAAGTSDLGTTVFTGADGNANLPLSGDILPGPFAIIYDVPIGPNFFRVYCSRADGTEVPTEIAPGSGAVIIPDARGEGIVCDFFFVPVSQGGPTPTPGPESGSLTIRKATCPVGYTGTNYFTDCYANATAGVTFSLSTQGSAVPGSSVLIGTSKTDANGTAFFENLGGSYVLEEDVPGEFAKAAAYCTDDGVPIAIGFSADNSRLALDVAASQDIRCDYYNIPFDLRGETPTPGPAPTKAPVTSLPNTGARAVGAENGRGGLLVAVMLVAGVGVMGALSLRRRATR